MASKERFKPQDMKLIQAGLAKYKSNQLEFFPIQVAQSILYEPKPTKPEEITPKQADLPFMDRELPDKELGDEEIGLVYEKEKREVPLPKVVLRKDIQEEWLVGFSEDFQKSIQGIDRKLLGRVLAIIPEIIKNPFQAKGNTVQPLTDELKGFWRYRVGNYRLVYFPDLDNKKIVLLAFTSRGKAYQ